jgi:hypothetical protein
METRASQYMVRGGQSPRRVNSKATVWSNIQRQTSFLLSEDRIQMVAVKLRETDTRSDDNHIRIDVRHPLPCFFGDNLLMG